MPDLTHQIHARLAGFGCCEGYTNPGLDRARAAVLAALGCHPRMPYGMVNEQLVAVASCGTCDEPYPCREVRYIADALGFGATDA